MEQLKKFLSEKKKHLGVILIGLQGLGGLALGSYFIRPAVVGTAAVAVSTPLYAVECTEDGHLCIAKCHEVDVERRKKETLAVIVAASVSKNTSTSTSTSTATSTSSCTTCRMFVTAATYSGNLGGITGADSKCASDSNKPSTGTYKALIVDGTNRRACSTANCSGGISENISWVLKANTTYTRTDGTTLGTTNAAAIITGSLTNALTTGSYNEFRTGMSFNTTPDWIAHATAHCTNFSATTGSGTCGTTNATAISTGGGGGANFLYSNGTSCATSVALVCVEQ